MRKTLQRAMSLVLLAILGVTAGWAQSTLPYSVDFQEGMGDWTAIDKSTTPDTTWTYTTGLYSAAAQTWKKLVVLKHDAVCPHNDYLVSPAFELKKGKRYSFAVTGQRRGYALLGAEIGKSSTDMSANEQISADISGDLHSYYYGYMDYNGTSYVSTATVEYSPEEDGTYYFSLHAYSTGSENDDSNYFYLTGAAVETVGGEGPVDLPYSTTFETAPKYWTALDASEVAYRTWAWGDFYDYATSTTHYGMVNTYDGDYAWNDYYISPEFTLEAGKNYKVKTRAWKNSDPSDFNLALMIGTSVTDASTFSKIADIEMQYNYDADKTDDHVFTVKESGNYRVAYLATTTTTTNQKIALDYFDIEETTDPVDVTPTDLPYEITFNSTNDVWTTIDNSATPGTTWAFNDSWGDDGFCLSGSWTAIPSYCIVQDKGVADDYYVSPAFKLEAGKTYTVKTYTGQMYDPSHNAALSIEYGKSSTDASAFTKISDIAMESASVQYANSYDVTPEADGIYYFAYHMKQNDSESDYKGYAYNYVFSFGIGEKTSGGDEPSEEDVVEVPYSITFDSYEKTATWTAIDNSTEKDIYSWQHNDYAYYDSDTRTNVPGAAFTGDWAAAANDYFVSPAMTLEAGKTYKFSANTMLRTEDSNMILSFVYGTSKTDAATFSEVGAIASGTTYDAARADEATFTVPATGNYYVGILGKSPESATTQSDWQKSQAAIFNFAVEEVVLPEDTLDVPYSLTFTAENVGTWKSFNNAESSEANKWAWDATGYQEKDADGNNVGDPHPSVRITTDATNSINACFYSPALRLKEGKTYNVSFKVRAPKDNEMAVQYVYTKDRTQTYPSNIDYNYNIPTAFEAKDSVYSVEITKDGIYYFGVKTQTWQAGNELDLNFFSFSIEEAAPAQEDTTVALPYSIDFTQYEKKENEWGYEEAVDPSTAWTMLDRSESVSSTWRWSTWGYTEYDENWQVVGETHPALGFNSDWNTDANDYAVSPAFELKAGRTYGVTANVTVNRTCLEAATTKLSLEVGTEKKLSSSYKEFATIKLHTEYDSAISDSVYTFTVEEDGKYYVALHIQDEKGENAYGYMMQFAISDITPAAPAAATDLTATAVEADKAIHVAWTNPTTDADGNALEVSETKKLDIQVYLDDELVKTVSYTEAKATDECDVVPATYEGEHKVKLVAVYNGMESEPVETTINIVVDGINGVTNIPAGANVTVRTLGGAVVGNSMSALAKGTYIVTVREANGNTKSFKITK